MDKNWISKLAGEIEARHGKEARDKIFGDIDSVENNPLSLSAWFDNFTTGMDKLDDKEFLQQMMENTAAAALIRRKAKKSKSFMIKVKPLRNLSRYMINGYMKCMAAGIYWSFAVTCCI